MAWSPCMKHKWKPVDRVGVHRCTVCGAAASDRGFGSFQGKWQRERVVPYQCPRCKGDTQGQMELCPICEPLHPFNLGLETYEEGLMDFLALTHEHKEVFEHIRAMGPGWHLVRSLQVGVGRKPCTGFLMALYHKDMLEKKKDKRGCLWRATERGCRSFEMYKKLKGSKKEREEEVHNLSQEELEQVKVVIEKLVGYEQSVPSRLGGKCWTLTEVDEDEFSIHYGAFVFGDFSTKEVAEFVVTSRDALPRLLAEVVRLREEVASLKEET